MAIKVTRVADIVNGEICFLIESRRRDPFLEVITDLYAVGNPDLRFCWKVEIQIGEGANAKWIKLDIPPLISTLDSLDNPIFIGDGRIIYFRDHLFTPVRSPRNASEREEISLRVKKAVYDEEAELLGLRSAVANLEAAIEFNNSGPKRERIPEDVKRLVWTRDGGACSRCGAKENLHFDHIIPVAKGGGYSEMNIQILCERCNLQKADKIAN